MKKTQSGLTLIELLATMVLFGLIMGLVATAMGQVGHVLRVSHELDAGFISRWRQTQLYREIIENLALDPQIEKPFIGREDRLEFSSFASPYIDFGIAQRLLIQIKSDDTGADKSIVELSPLNTRSGYENQGTKKPENIRLASLPEPVSFKFIDGFGMEHSLWPPQGLAKPEALPSAVLIRSKYSKQDLQMHAVFRGRLQASEQDATGSIFGGIK